MDDEESKTNGQIFLKTLVHFEGVEKYLKDEDFLGQILKDTNFQVTKRNISYMGGKLMIQIEQNKVSVLMIMPLDEDVVSAVMNKKHCDHHFWKAKNNALFQQYDEIL